MTKFSAASAAQAGAYHLLSRTPCQDSVSVFIYEEGICAVLCDGAGSVSRSEVISRSVSAHLCRAVSECFGQWYEADDESIRKLIAALADEAVKEKDPSLRAECTLILFAAEKDRSMLVHIGDGIAGDAEHVISLPENGADEWQTFFLSSESALQHIRITRDPEWKDLLLLSSDGLSSVLYDKVTGRAAPAVGIMREWLQEDAAEAEARLRKTMHHTFMDYTGDDMSVILICRQ